MPTGETTGCVLISRCMLVNELVLAVRKDPFANNNMACWRFIIQSDNWIWNKRLDWHRPWGTSLPASLGRWRNAGGLWCVHPVLGGISSLWLVRWAAVVPHLQPHWSCHRAAAAAISTAQVPGDRARLSSLSHVKIHTWPHRTAPSHAVSLLEPQGSCSEPSLRQCCTCNIDVWNRVKPSQMGAEVLAELLPVLVTPPLTRTKEPLIPEVLKPNKSGKDTLPP